MDPLSPKVLINHAPPSAGDVTEGYILRSEIEKVAAFLLASMGGGE